MQEFQRGDWVVYDPGYKQEIGRVWKDNGATIAVCYHQGCTPNRTRREHVFPYSKEKYPNLKPIKTIGFHRFDTECSCYNPEICSDCTNKIVDDDEKSHK